MVSEYLLQDSRSNTGDRLMFWKEGGGYCSSLDHAQRFTRDSAVQHNADRETDQPWPLAYLVDRHELAVDHQYVTPKEIGEALAIEEQAYLCVAGCWNGNDLIWLGGDGDHTADLSHAKVFAVDVAVSVSAGCDGGLKAIPKGLADRLARKVAPSRRMDINNALKGTGIILARPKKTRRTVDRCDHCGCFISEAQRFGDCPKCEGSNAP